MLTKISDRRELRTDGGQSVDSDSNTDDDEDDHPGMLIAGAFYYIRVYYLDEGTGTTLCGLDGEYASVSLDKAKPSAFRVCRRCESTQNGGYSTRPCPHRNKAVVITH